MDNFTRVPTRENAALAHNTTSVESILGLIPRTILVSDLWSSESFLVILNECYATYACSEHSCNANQIHFEARL